MIGELLKGVIGPIIAPLVDRIPDPNERARAKEAMEAQIVGAANAALLAQIKVNEAEANHRSLFVAGWRPYVGWSMATGMILPTVVLPVFSWMGAIAGFEVPPPPEIDTAMMTNMLMGMLGFGGMRSWEKSRGVASK